MLAKGKQAKSIPPEVLIRLQQRNRALSRYNTHLLFHFSHDRGIIVVRIIEKKTYISLKGISKLSSTRVRLAAAH